MIRTRMFRRTYVLTVLTIVIFLLLGDFLSRMVMRFADDHKEGPSSAFYAHLVEELGQGDPLKGIEKADSWRDKNFPIEFYLVDSSGSILFPQKSPLKLDWDNFRKPAAPFESIANRCRHDPPEDRYETIRLAGQTPEYLLIRHHHHGPKPPMFALFASLAVSILLGVGVSLYLFFRSLQDKAALADSVLAELQHGNLKARFPIGKLDEVGRAMQRFNLMADEIERLVENLRSVEKSRINLLQELAHDLRTPIASLRSLLETLSMADEKIDPSVQREVLALAQKETDYFERLVEDLLVLAQVSDPKYRGEADAVNLNDLLQDESEQVAAKYNVDGARIHLKLLTSTEPIQIEGDFHLLKRMLRNVLENAFSFAKSEVTVSLNTVTTKNAHALAQISVTDDGGGFTPEALRVYGERRISRALSESVNGRVSVGLGSVIICTVAQLHRGKVKAENVTVNGKTGAEVTIQLPQSTS